MWEIVGSIVLEGVQTFREERRTRFLDEYKDILDRIDRAKNSKIPMYTDAEYDLSLEERIRFLEAYYRELKGHNREENS